jgi:hypothetical protein
MHHHYDPKIKQKLYTLWYVLLARRYARPFQG